MGNQNAKVSNNDFELFKQIADRSYSISLLAHQAMMGGDLNKLKGFLQKPNKMFIPPMLQEIITSYITQANTISGEALNRTQAAPQKK